MPNVFFSMSGTGKTLPKSKDLDISVGPNTHQETHGGNSSITPEALKYCGAAIMKIPNEICKDVCKLSKNIFCPVNTTLRLRKLHNNGRA